MGQGASPVLCLLWMKLKKSKINKDRKRGDARSHAVFLTILSSVTEVKHWNNCQEWRYLLIPVLSHGLLSKAVFIRPGSFHKSSHKSTEISWGATQASQTITCAGDHTSHSKSGSPQSVIYLFDSNLSWLYIPDFASAVPFKFLLAQGCRHGRRATLG